MNLINAESARERQTSLLNEKVNAAISKINSKIMNAVEKTDTSMITYHDPSEKFLQSLIPHLDRAGYKSTIHRPPKDPRDFGDGCYLNISW